MKICYNNHREDLYCLECKEKIEIGQKYVIVYEEYFGEVIEKYYHLDHVAVVDETDEVYISEEE